MPKKKRKKNKPKNDSVEVEILPAADPPAKKQKTASTKSVVAYDPLVAYLREIKELSKLNPEEEKNLAIQYRENDDLKAAYQLVSSNLWLVVKIARQYEKMAKNILDLIQEGNMGLMEAVKNFDPHRGVRLPSYATWWIKAYIIRYILANWRMVKIGTTQAQKKLFFNLNREKRKLEQEGFKPNPKLIAQRLNVKESEVIEMEQRLGSADLSVDAPISASDESDASWHSILPADLPDSEEILAEKETKEMLEKAIQEFSKSLNPREQMILNNRILNEEKITLQDLAEELEVSIERVRQIENRIKEKFKTFIEENFQSLKQ